MKENKSYKIAAEILERNKDDTKPYSTRTGIQEEGDSSRKKRALAKLSKEKRGK